ncbi:hypothetical protein U1Q18_020691 [Sarracenia purpurea var. burkii]
MKGEIVLQIMPPTMNFFFFFFFFFFFLLLIQPLFLLNITTCNGQSIPVFTSVLIFGDSTVDTGNNNFIKTLFKSNHLPYGQDFPGRHSPTGRFSNGRLPPDFVAASLGIKDAVPPFLDPNLSDNDLVTGVSFASAGSGYDELTSFISSSITMSKQLDYFRSYIERLNGIVGKDAAKNITNSALVIVSAGTNDYAYNFYDIPTRKFEYTLDGYQEFLLNKVQKFVKELYSIGCRNIVVSGLPPIGCLPIQMTAKLDITRTCIEGENLDARTHNQKLAELLPQLQQSLPGSLIAYADIYTPLSDMSHNPQKYGKDSQKLTKDAAGLDCWKQLSFVTNSLQCALALPNTCFGMDFTPLIQATATFPTLSSNNSFKRYLTFHQPIDQEKNKYG